MFRTCIVTHILLLFLLNLSALNVHLRFVVGCHEVEREALFKFKQSFIHLNNGLSSWKGKNCCHWEGVDCDNVTSFVNRLDLSNRHNFYCSRNSIGKSLPFLIAPKLDHSLLELKHLNYLDLSCNDFQRSQIPDFIGAFKYLRHLNLAYSNFSGVVPSQVGNLTRLRTLDLSFAFTSYIDYALFDKKRLFSDLRWASTLVNLQYLSMNDIIISHAKNSRDALNMLPLLGLQLASCNLGTAYISTLFSNATWLSRIQQLDLTGNDLKGPLPHVITNMASLKSLQLSSNLFINGSIPLSLGNMRNLEYLDLSGNLLEGSLPHSLANMTTLRHLLLSSNKFNGSIPLWMRNMRNLEYLDLSYNSFSRVEGGALMGILGHLCKLKTFSVSYNSVEKIIGANHNFSKCINSDLEDLWLSGNMIGGPLPPWLGDFKYLSTLDISHNKIHGPIPESIGKLANLEMLDLSRNNITGILPDCLGGLEILTRLDVRGNNISGRIPASIGRLAYLEELDLSYNSLNGNIPKALGQCKSLVRIDLSSNFLQGSVSESHFANLSRLDRLDLSFNPLNLNLSSNWVPPFQLTQFHMKSCNIQSQFPHCIGEQTKLEVLDLSDNNISGELLQWFPSLQLFKINVSHNQITGEIPYFSCYRLSTIDLSYNLLSGPLLHDDPSAKNDIVGTSVCQLPSLVFLHLQKNMIAGTIPDCWGNSESLVYINLSSNNLSGSIPMTMGLLPELRFLKLSSNSLQGPIPPTLSTSSNLQILDLGENKLVGKMPINWGGNISPVLEMLRLRGNQLVGVIPTTLCALPMLQFIDLAHNNLTGAIPRCFGHLIHMDSSPSPNLSTDDYVNDGPAYAPTYTDPQEDSTMVVLKGAERQYTTTLKFVVNLDLSCNALVGSIPEEITDLSALIGLNLSHNHLTGNIPIKIGEMRSLESLDLSNNDLTGIIPSSMSTLNSLSSLNLSYNNLHGQIPTGRQLQTLDDPSAYQGNPGLCGDPLPNKCKTSHDQNQPTQVQEEPVKEDNWGKPLFYFVIFSGFATGFWGVVGSLLLKRRFRFALFQLVDRITDYFYVQVMVRINRLGN